MANCLENLAQSFANRIPERDMAILQRKLDNLHKEFAGNPAEFREAAFDMLNEYRVNYQADLVRRANDLAIYSSNIQQAERMFANNDFVGAIDSLLSRTGRYQRTNIEASVDSTIAQNGNAMVAIFNKHMPNGEWKVYLNDTSITKDIFVEVHNLGQLDSGKPPYKDTNNPVAKQLAKAVKEWNDYMFIQKRKAGFTLEHRSDYVVGMQYNAQNIRAALPDAQAAISFYREILDIPRLKKEFGLKTEADVDAHITELYNTLSEKDFTVGLAEEGSPRAANLLGSLDYRISRSRTLPYKSPEAFYEAFSKLGQENLFAAMFSGLKKESRIIGRAAVLGTDASMGFKKFYLETLRKAKAAGDEKAIQTLTANEKVYEQRLRLAAGLLRHPADGIVAKGISAAHMTANLHLLGGAALAAGPTDIAFGMSMQMGATSNNAISAFFEQIGNMKATLSKGTREELAKELDLMLPMILDDMFMDSMGTPELAAKNNTGPIMKSLSYVHEKFMAATLIKQGAIGGRTWSGRVIAKAVAMGDSATTRWLGNYGITDANDIAFLKAGTHDGYVSVEKLGDITIDEYKAIIGNKTKTVSKTVENPDGSVSFMNEEVPWADTDYMRHKTKTINAYRQMVWDYAHMSSPTPTRQMGYKIFGDADPNTFMGAANRFIGMYKSFMFAVYTNLAESLYRGKNGASRSWLDGHLGMHLLLGTMAGAGVVWLKDIAKGKTPSDPSNPSFWLKAMDQSGTTGLFGSIVFAMAGDTYARGKQDFPSDIGGPIIGRMIPDAIDVGSALFNEGKIVAGETFGMDTSSVTDPELLNLLGRKSLRWAPGTNLWFSEALLKHWFLDRMNGALNPRYDSLERARMEQASGNLWEQTKYLEE